MTTAGPNGDGKCGAERWEGLKTKTLPYNGNCLNCRCPLAKLTAGCFARCLWSLPFRFSSPLVIAGRSLC